MIQSIGGLEILLPCHSSRIDDVSFRSLMCYYYSSEPKVISHLMGLNGPLAYNGGDFSDENGYLNDLDDSSVGSLPLSDDSTRDLGHFARNPALESTDMANLLNHGYKLDYSTSSQGDGSSLSRRNTPTSSDNGSQSGHGRTSPTYDSNHMRNALNGGHVPDWETTTHRDYVDPSTLTNEGHPFRKSTMTPP